MSDTGTARLVLPGDLLGTAEEFVPGWGTYEDHGKIYAALMGHTNVSPNDHAIRVDAVNAIPRIAEKDLVYARVDEVKSAMAVCTVMASFDSRRVVPGAPEGTVHISKAKDGYTDSLGDEFAPGDILLAQVLQSHPTIKLTTQSQDLGVVSARCQVCHGLLASGPKELVCPRCGNRERRKTAHGYGVLKGVRGGADGPGAH
ncbi:MAG: exosome complex RNA-binding protein Csl4 [Thermoplasmata archaeon]|nr:exosome complex RNA-binding protein Csl4 [Thermoplasmata archaeon]